MSLIGDAMNGLEGNPSRKNTTKKEEIHIIFLAEQMPFRVSDGWAQLLFILDLWKSLQPIVIEHGQVSKSGQETDIIKEN